MKKRYDPANLFRVNLNIAPEVAWPSTRFAVSRVDARGCAQSGATATAAAAYERALAAFQGWRAGAEAELAPALQEAPGFVMAHVLDGCLRVASRDPRQVRSAAPMLARAAALPMNRRERLHVAALRAVLDDDYEGAKARLGKLLRKEPRDVLALQMAHAFDHVTGDVARMHDRVAARAAGVVARSAGIRRRARDACLRPRGVGRVRATPSGARGRRSRSIPATRARITPWRTSSR